MSARAGCMDDLIKDFLVETAEALAGLDGELMRLEAEPGNLAIISSLFRILHTIKGTCGFLGFSKLGRLAHASENVLGGLRDATLKATPGVIDAILRCIDAMKDLVSTIEATGAEGSADHVRLIAELDALCDARSAAQPGTVSPDMATSLSAGMPERVGQDAIPCALPAAASAIDVAAHARETSLAGQTVRVSVGLLEGLMTSVSELVLTRNQLLQLLRGAQDSAFGAPLQRLSAITSELQNSIMKARLQPVGTAWTALPRLVRDLAQELGKKIELRMEGADTELDRQVLELIKDPLTHMVRNSADHGLEPPAARRAAGKLETGQIRLNAFHDSGRIVIEVSDDGTGLDAGRIRRKAVQNGLVGAAEAARLTDAQIFRFIMRPGFSTAAAVTAVSGRGVGMDVVRANIEKIGGTIDIASRPGQGATFTLKIPLTLAIISSLIVGCGGERFALPQTAVMELVGAGPGDEHRIERINDAEVLRLRNHLLPLINLRSLLKLGNAGGPADDTLVIVASAGSRRFGIVVDQVFDAEDIVVKPVAPLLKSLGVYSGNTILGDGSVCMILDPLGLATTQGQTGDAADDAPDATVAQRETAPDGMRLLLVRAGGGMRKAIPLDLVARIEEIDLAAIHRSDGKMLVHYGDRLIPVMPAAADMALRPGGPQKLLVFDWPAAADGAPKPEKRQMGLLVDEIVDIVETAVVLQASGRRPDLAGSALIGGLPTEVLNIAHFLAAAGEEWSPGALAADHGGRACVLVADPNAFFRSLIASTLQVAGFDVRTAANDEDALAILKDGEPIALLLASTDMPGLCAYDLARRLSQIGKPFAPPVIGLSSQVTEEDRQRSSTAGFLRHLQKLDQKTLAEAVKDTLQDRVSKPKELVA